MSYPEIVLDMDKVSVAYGSKTVFSDLSLSIQRGDVYALLGPNGAGKTTLVRTILGRVKASQGTIVTGSRGVGLVPQDIALYPRLTIRENLMAFGVFSGLARKDVQQRVAELVDLFDFSERSDQLVSELSGGWQRRVNLAAAVLNHPALLILDEPTVGVDKSAREGLHALLRKLVNSGTSILMTTHDFAEAETLCTHVLFMKDGRSIAQGAIVDLLETTFKGQCVVSVEMRPETSASGLDILKDYGLHARTGGLAEAVLPLSQARQLLTDLSHQTHQFSRAGFEHPTLRNLYHHLIEDLQCP